MPTYKIDGVTFTMTPQEEVAYDADKERAEAKKPMRKWKSDLQTTDSGMPRYMEDLITSNSSLVIPAEMKERYDEKIKVRGERP